MDPQSGERRLAAIFAADMAGYCRLMEADEAGTLARLKAHRLEVFDPAIAAHRGRLIKTTGDGMLVEFQSAVDAVTCAVEIQRKMARRNADVAPEVCVQFRIGINVGDVIFEDGDVFGDGVNVAARIEPIATAGGICISAAVRDHMGDRLGVTFEDIGEQTVKNIARPIRVFRVGLGDAQPRPMAVEANRGARTKPALVVMPLVNMSGDPEQEMFADGLTEDILTELSRFHELTVISRNSAFRYKGKPVKTADIAREFCVQYVVEGSVRKAGERIRVTVQLIDAETDQHLWAERYDRKIEDIFEIQDEVTRAIVATLPGRIEAASRERAARKSTANMAAYECLLAGKVLHHRSNRDDNAEAQRLLDRAIALDPGYAHAHAWKACVLGQSWVHGWSDDRAVTWDNALAELSSARQLDDNDSDVHRILAAVNIVKGDLQSAWQHQQRALELNPNNDLIVVQHGEILTWLGRPEEGVDWIKQAMRLNPFHPERFWSHLGRAHYTARQYPEAIAAYGRLSKLDAGQQAFLAAAHAHMGDADAAAAHAAKLRELVPAFSIERHLATLCYKQDTDREHLRQGLRKAGMPD
jgi:adenylate cyclase